MTYHVQFLLLVLAGWVNRQQQDVIDYLREENRVLCQNSAQPASTKELRSSSVSHRCAGPSPSSCIIIMESAFQKSRILAQDGFEELVRRVPLE